MQVCVSCCWGNWVDIWTMSPSHPKDSVSENYFVFSGPFLGCISSRRKRQEEGISTKATHSPRKESGSLEHWGRQRLPLLWQPFPRPPPELGRARFPWESAAHLQGSTGTNPSCIPPSAHSPDSSHQGFAQGSQTSSLSPLHRRDR